ncbi:biotin--[acetyl-CoA-carboxylase] ligase [Subtercola lobariae]|uniref:biotin--[biotin carboxyl-carrier protein] ligase n=1 Tax=Subtercola lobariae TaxID=1588641 RepID=A0A917B0H0_9MICO|nr:biotin--[acetyl-CoA-carboxylase] ligase [Subtercola lobariae]GGF13932.1 biotin--[acetyl-CoA-carboxylase] ligase [Subtercola lobariae]
MNLPQSEAVVPRLVWLAESASTNTELVAAVTGPDAASWPDLSVMLTDNQTAGRGRLGRVWSAPAGASLAISVLVRPSKPLPIESLAWLPLVAGVAMSRAVNEILGVTPVADDGESSADADDAHPYRELSVADITANEAIEDAAAVSPAAAVATVKWPNDVLIGRAKVSGILSELLPGATGVVVGSGVNLFLTEEQLPVPTATSIALAGGVDFTADDLLSAYLRSFTELYELFVLWGGDAAESGIAAIVADACSTLGQPVSVELPAGDVLTGIASGLDESGRLVVVRDTDARTIAVSAGDVTHLRY